MGSSRKKYLALSGGVGGAKLALGLSKVLSPGQLTVIANTGDDFTHMGLYVSPDLDSNMYAIAGLNDTERGWGVANESWAFMDAAKRLGAPDWFQLGDQDLATHILRTSALRDGQSLSEITTRLCEALHINCRLLPMSDDAVRTMVNTSEGRMEFQKYFVEQKCNPIVTGFDFEGIKQAKPQSEFINLLSDKDLAGIIICPSNPYVSIDPILSLPGVEEALKESHAKVLAVSPIIDGRAVKGPAAKMMKELGKPVTAAAIADHYGSLLDIFVHDQKDTDLNIDAPDYRLVSTNTMMKTLDDKTALARHIISEFEACV